MNKKKVLLALIFQFLFFAKMFSQTNHFMIGWYDYSTISTSDNTMAKQFKDMQTHNINCAIVVDWRLIRLTTNSWADPQNFQWASSNPSKAFLDSAYKYGIKVILSTPENSVIRVKPPSGAWYIHSSNSIERQQGLAYWGNHPALLGFHIMDEPLTYDDLSYIPPHANDIKVFNSNLIRWVNFPFACPNTLNHANYGQFIQDYINMAQPNILSFDYYPIMDNPYINTIWGNALFYHLDTFARKSVTNNIPFVYVLSSLRCNPPPSGGCVYEPLPNLVNATSYCMYAGLFYGAKGFVHWNSSRYVNDYRFSTEYREFVKTIHKKILDNETVLLSLSFRSAYHKTFKSTIGPGNDSIPSYSAWSYFSRDVYAKTIFNVSNPLIAMSGSTIDSLAVSFLTDNNGGLYFWVFNKSLVASEDIKLNLNNGGVVDVLDANQCLSTDAVIHLEPAEAKLFKFRANQTVSGVINTNTTIKGHRVILDVKVQNGAKLTIEACETEFTDGFEIESGAEFEIK